jgi:hypothetical protein
MKKYFSEKFRQIKKIKKMIKHFEKAVKKILLNRDLKRTIKQRKINLKLESPWDVLEKWKKKQREIPKLEEDKVPPFKVISVKDKILDENIRLYEEAKKTNDILGDEILKEEPVTQGLLFFNSSRIC